MGAAGIGIQGPSGAPGAPGTNGINGTNGTNGNTILNGSGTPAAGLGVNGDFYIDTAANKLFGPKTGAGWGTGVTLASSPAAAGVTLQLNASVGNSVTTAIGTSLAIPDVVTFANVITAPTPATGNSWSGNNTFTVGAGGAGLYQINVQFVSATNGTPCIPMVDMNNSGPSATSFYGTGQSLNITAQSPTKYRGTVNVVTPLSAGETFQIRALSGSNVIGCDLPAGGINWVRVVKLN
jgi:hypothetical protein